RGSGGEQETAVARGDGPVKWQHFRTFVWLHWRIRANQLRRGGVANAVILAILAAIGALAAAGGFAGLFLLGMLGLPRVDPTVVMYVWDALAIAFLFFWLIGLIQELQRAEACSLDKF